MTKAPLIERLRRNGRYRPKGAPIVPATPADMGKRPEPRFLPVGDIGISVQFGTEIDLAANECVAALDRLIAASTVRGVVETVPSFRSLLVIFEPTLVDRTALLTIVQTLAGRAGRASSRPGRRWSIPVVYEQPFGEDLPEVADLLGLSPKEVVAAHTGSPFRVYMLGFQPGRPNLGGLPPELFVSRRTSPRAPVPGGSVMIGGGQGAIMPLPTPTGFYLLGRTPIRLFDRRRPEPALLKAGDTIRFRQIGTAEFAAIDSAIAGGDLDAGVLLEAMAA